MYMYIACDICSITVLGRPFIVTLSLRALIQPPSLTAWHFSYLLYICSCLVLILLHVPI